MPTAEHARPNPWFESPRCTNKLASAAADKVQQVAERAGDIARQMAEQSREAGEIEYW